MTYSTNTLAQLCGRTVHLIPFPRAERFYLRLVAWVKQSRSVYRMYIYASFEFRVGSGLRLGCSGVDSKVSEHDLLSSAKLLSLQVLWSLCARGARVGAGGGQRGSVVHGLSSRPAGRAPVRRTRAQIHRTAGRTLRARAASRSERNAPQCAVRSAVRGDADHAESPVRRRPGRVACPASRCCSRRSCSACAGKCRSRPSHA